MAAAVRSTFKGEHTAAGLVIINVGIAGCAGITTFDDGSDVHPAELVTV